MTRLYFLLILTIAFGCNSGEKHNEITETREVSKPTLAFEASATSAERFGFLTSPSPLDSTNKLSIEKSPFSWTTPKGWSENQITPMRLVNLKVTEVPEAECYLTVLSGNAGGILKNVNRWRSQVSLPSLTQEDVDKLPPKKLFGKNAYFVECEGTYTGMRGETSKPNYKLLGLILQHQGISIFVKMIGPATIIDAEKANFEIFCSSLSIAPTSPKMVPHSNVSNKETTNKNNIIWEAPKHWKVSDGKPMRLVSFTMGTGEQGECYLTVLPGEAGGLNENINRWRRQMGHAPLDEVDLKNLPSIPVLEREAKLIELSGNFTNMAGVVHKDYLMIALLCQLRGSSLFVKMIGPETILLQEKKHFITFCKSLRIQ